MVDLKYGSGRFDDLPGNADLDYQEFLKYGQRENRYGIFGDNGYEDLVEIKKRPVAVIEKAPLNPSQAVNTDLRRSREGVFSAF